MRVFMVPVDHGACGYFRIREPGRVAASLGVDVQVMHSPDWLPRNEGVQILSTQDPNTGNDVVMEVMHDCDVMVIQRPFMQPLWAVAVQAKKQGIKVVVELDDDLHALHRKNTAALSIDPQKQPNHNVEWAQRTIDLADMLIVSTPALTRYGPEKAVVVRNWLPEQVLGLAPDVSPVRDVVGWTGAINVHPEDLQVTDGALGRVGNPITVVGDERGVADALKIPLGKVRLGAPWQVDIPAYWAQLPQHIGVGITPLQQSAFNRAKSWLKPMEMAALGIPYVASPLPEYQRLTRETKAGFIAESRGQWARMVQRLLKDDDVYGECRANGLAWAKENTLEQRIGEHIDAWTRAANA